MGVTYEEILRTTVEMHKWTFLQDFPETSVKIYMAFHLLFAIYGFECNTVDTDLGGQGARTQLPARSGV